MISDHVIRVIRSPPLDLGTRTPIFLYSMTEHLRHDSVSYKKGGTKPLSWLYLSLPGLRLSLSSFPMTMIMSLQAGRLFLAFQPFPSRFRAFQLYLHLPHLPPFQHFQSRFLGFQLYLPLQPLRLLLPFQRFHSRSRLSQSHFQPFPLLPPFPPFLPFQPLPFRLLPLLLREGSLR
ncbi:hypothetical protein ARMGADRAFT_478804 [Armillaria gallica]|uniref:Uncharacterized protein n=1 Tax=Armillaria gallica TaxID=47427 RepID=A0A2H3D5M7_ARMGA|nr:hypothetical protein ARMGADRAFT_478804 [Armillaria gallica]